jgi:hypothetical protein
MAATCHPTEQHKGIQKGQCAQEAALSICSEQVHARTATVHLFFQSKHNKTIEQIHHGYLEAEESS